MLKLFAKELKLNVPKGMYLFVALVLLMLAPNYPSIVGVGYIIMLIFRYFQWVQANRSQEFSMLLPVKRSDIAKSMILVVVFFELLAFALAGICALLCRYIYPDGNLVGLDGNLAFLGVALGCFGAFNLVFLPKYFKTGEKYGWPLIWGLVAFLLFYGLCETAIQAVPALRNSLDSYASTFIWARLIALSVGIVIYCVSTLLATKISVKRFEKVNL